MNTELAARFAPDALRAYFSRFLSTIWLYKWGFMTFLIAMVALQHFITLGLAFDHSIPDDHLYLIKKWDRTPIKGMRLALHPKGGHIGPPAELVMVKFVRGVPGDRIHVSGREVWVNHELIGHAKPFSRQGLPLTIIPDGIIPDGYVFVAGVHKDSFDSRYQDLGLVPEAAIVGRVLTLF